MKVIITIDWHTKVRPVRRDELATHGMQRANEMMQEGYIEGELLYTDGKGREYSGWWKRKVEVD